MEEALLFDLISTDRYRMGVLRLVAELELPDAWVAAGFVRNAVWDQLHDRPMTPLADIDVIYCDPARPDPAIDENLELELAARAPKKPWSVFNVAREKNGRPGHTSCESALRAWPETATSVGLALAAGGTQLDILAPFGLTDLFDLVVRPTASEMTDVVAERAEKKRWFKLWPKLKLRDPK